MADSKTASLTVLGGPLAGAQCVLPESGTLTIGSSPGSSLYLDLPAVSPYHARVVAEGGRVTVHDTGSSRTVHVNDNAIGPEGTELRNGDILWLGAPGDEDVVMLQCILPKRSAPAIVTPAPPALSSGATPTPEIETVALWATQTDGSGDGALADAVAEAAAAASDLEQEPAAEAVLPAIADAAVMEPAEAEEAELSEPAEPTPAAALDDDAYIVAAHEAPEPVGFVEEAAVVEPAAEAPVAESADELAEVAPTLLMSSADEVSEAVDPGYQETVNLSSPPQFTPEMFTPIVPAEEPPTLEAAAAVEEASFEPAVPEAAAAAAPAVPPEPAPAPAPPPRAPAAPRPAAAVARPKSPSSSQRLPPSASQRQKARPAPVRAPEPEPPAGEEDAAAAAPSRSPALLAAGGFAAVLALAGGGYFAWRSFSGGSSRPAATPTPVARAVEPTPAPIAATPTPEVAAPVVEPTPEPVAATPEPAAAAQPQLAATPTPRPTPTPRATPTPAAAATAAATPTPAPAGPSPEQQRAQQAQALIGQAEAAATARQYDAALGHVDGALRLDPGNARAASLRADVSRRRDLARRRFVPGRTVVDSEEARKEKARGGPVGFDTDDKAPDFSGRIEFEMSPAQGLEANDAWTLRVFVVNQGGKPIRVQGVTLGTTVNGSGGAAPVTPGAREVAPRQRVQVAESTGAWPEGTTAWVAEATITAPRNESLKNTLTWR